MRESGFTGDTAEHECAAAAEALREALSRADKGIAVLDAEDVHRHDFVNLLSDKALQIVIVIRSAFPRGLETALAVEEALSTSDGSGPRVLAAPWGESRFPSVALVEGAPLGGAAYRLAIGRSGSAPSPLAFTALVDAHQDMAAAVDQWFMRVWNLSTELNRVRELKQPVFGKADAGVIAELTALWDRFVEGVRSERGPAPPHASLSVDTESADGSGFEVDPADDTSEPWALFPIEPPGAPPEQQQEPTDAPAVPGEGETSILAVQPSPPLERDLREIYARGVLVSVHTSHKVPTFRLDVNAALGIAESARSGRASVRSPIRLNILPEAISKEIERSKRYASNLLASHSILIADNQHWMPQSAEGHFKTALEAKGDIGMISDLLGESIEAFVAENFDEYVQSLTDVFARQQISFKFTPQLANRLRQEIFDYLQVHKSVTVRSSYSTEALGYAGAKDGDYTRPFTILLKTAKTSRRRVLAGESGRRKIPAPPVETLDVVGGDKLLSCFGTRAHLAALTQLAEIEQIADAGPSRDACQALIALMRSDPEPTYA